MGTFIGIIVAIIIFAVILGLAFIYSTLAWGLVLHKFWGWFVLPVFTDLPDITFVEALGLMFVIGLFKGVMHQSIKKEYRDTNAEYALLLAPWVSLFFGWLAYAIWLA